MRFCGNRDLPFLWETPSGMIISYAVGKVQTLRAGLNFVREGSGVQINTINKDIIDIKSSVIGLMPNFIHSLDASHIHELTDSIILYKIDEIKKELTSIHNRYENLDVFDK